MSTMTATTPQGLVEAILAQLPSRDEQTSYVVHGNDRKIEIDIVRPEEKAIADDPRTPEQRREYMRERLGKRVVRGVGLSDWALSRECIYSEDT